MGSATSFSARRGASCSCGLQGSQHPRTTSVVVVFPAPHCEDVRRAVRAPSSAPTLTVASPFVPERRMNLARQRNPRSGKCVIGSSCTTHSSRSSCLQRLFAWCHGHRSDRSRKVGRPPWPVPSRWLGGAQECSF